MSRDRSGSCVSKTQVTGFAIIMVIIIHCVLGHIGEMSCMIFNHTWLNGFNEPQPEWNYM